MRLAPRLAVPVILLACSPAAAEPQVTVKEVPGGPAELKVPGNAPGSTRRHGDADRAPPTAHGDAGGRADGRRHGDAATDRRRHGATTGTRGHRAAGGGTEAPATGEDTRPRTRHPPPVGAQDFEDYCAENPGAC